MREQIPIFELYDVWYQPFWHSRLFFVMISCFLVLCMMGALWWYFKRKKNVPRDPWEEMVEKLTTLERSIHNDEKQHATIFYTELIVLIKSCLTGYYQLSCTSKTHEELIEDIQKLVLPSEFRTSLSMILHHATHVTFAQYYLTGQCMQNDLDAFRNFLNYQKISLMQK